MKAATTVVLQYTLAPAFQYSGPLKLFSACQGHYAVLFPFVCDLWCLTDLYFSCIVLTCALVV